jgi:hypothetical protein
VGWNFLPPADAPAHSQGSAPNPSIGNGLLELCDPGKASWTDGLCRGYINGVSDIGRDLSIVCYPSGVTNGQTVDIVMAGLRNNPGERHKASDGLVIKYPTAAFPCPPQK